MASDLDLTYAQVAFKASHNSYDRAELPVSTHLDDLGSAPSDGRCRGLELDLNLSGRNWLWSVNHIGGYGGDADQQLTAYLADLSRWHAANPDHHVVTVTLDLKGGGPLDKSAHTQSDFSVRLDAVLTEAFKDAIFRPQDLRGNRSTLLEGAANWPSLKALTGKFLFFLSGNGDLKKTYADGAGATGCCFIDKTLAPGDSFTPDAFPDIVFYNFDVDAWSVPERAARFRQIVKQIAEDGRCITRGYVINNAQMWTRTLDAGFSILTTDKVRGHAWAAVGEEPFMPRLRPARSAGVARASATRGARPGRAARPAQAAPSTRATKSKRRAARTAVTNRRAVQPRRRRRGK
jgi:hypothetical protein